MNVKQGEKPEACYNFRVAENKFYISTKYCLNPAERGEFILCIEVSRRFTHIFL
jgi:hypothetical protein